MKAVILAAGRGSRLQPYSDFLPKALMPIGISPAGSFETIIEKLIRQIRRAGIEEIVVVMNYRAEAIMHCLGDGAAYSTRISYVFQDKLDGNAGAFYRAQHLVAGSPVLVTDCDNDITDDDLFAAMRAAHANSGAACTVAVCEVEDVTKFAIIKTNADGKPVDIYEKPADAKTWGTLAKSGMMIFSAELVGLDRSISKSPAGDFTTTAIIKYCLEHDLLVLLHRIETGFHDIGTWSEYLPILRDRLHSQQ